MTSAKRKVITSLLVLAFVILGIMSVVAVVWGLETQTTKTNMSVSYSATRDVYASISCSSSIDNTKTEHGDVTMNGGTTSGSTTQAIEKITISSTASDKSAYIDFEITNKQQNKTKAEMFVKAVETSTLENLVKTISVSFGDDLNYTEFSETYICVQPNQTIYLRFRYKVQDEAYEATLTGGSITLNLFGMDNIGEEGVFSSTIASVGSYPQEYVGSSLNETLKSATLTKTSKSYTVDVNGTLTTLEEYLYNGIRYAKLDSALPFTTTTFSNDETIVTGATYFFKVQPILLNVFKKNDNTIYVAKSLLFAQAFSSDGKGKWEESTIRTFLNGTFLTQSGITATAIEIDNGTASGNETENANTTDKIWVPSETEITTWLGSSKNSIECTDLARATYASSYEGLPTYYTRSAYYSNEYSFLYAYGLECGAITPNTVWCGPRIAFSIA